MYVLKLDDIYRDAEHGAYHRNKFPSPKDISAMDLKKRFAGNEIEMQNQPDIIPILIQPLLLTYDSYIILYDVKCATCNVVVNFEQNYIAQ